ncbi:MAG: SDR family NAD(P)-dependent oxidoreductase [Ignavibacteriaceae bacterium]
MNKEKVVWITGGSSGIGKACVIEFARNGYTVWATSRRIEVLNELKECLKSDGIDISVRLCDVSNLDQVQETAGEILRMNGRINCLINAAGVSSFNRAVNDSFKIIREIIETNLFGAIFSIKSVLAPMKQQGGGTIINILSIVNKKVFTNSSAYAASKQGLQGYTESLREEVRRDKIRIVNVYPGATETGIWTDSVREKYRERMMQPEEVAKAILWSYKYEGNLVVEDLILRPESGDLP